MLLRAQVPDDGFFTQTGFKGAFSYEGACDAESTFWLAGLSYAAENGMTANTGASSTISALERDGSCRAP